MPVEPSRSTPTRVIDALWNTTSAYLILPFDILPRSSLNYRTLGVASVCGDGIHRRIERAFNLVRSLIFSQFTSLRQFYLSWDCCLSGGLLMRRFETGSGWAWWLTPRKMYIKKDNMAHTASRWVRALYELIGDVKGWFLGIGVII